VTWTNWMWWAEVPSRFREVVDVVPDVGVDVDVDVDFDGDGVVNVDLVSSRSTLPMPSTSRSTSTSTSTGSVHSSYAACPKSLAGWGPATTMAG